MDDFEPDFCMDLDDEHDLDMPHQAHEPDDMEDDGYNGLEGDC